MKEQILKLRAEGKNYNEIKDILGCSKGTISYHCGQGQRVKTNERRKQLIEKNPLYKKVESFKTVFKKCMRNRVEHFHRDTEKNFSYHDIIEKYGYETKCYLTGESVSFTDANSFTLDHIVPRSKGGSNTMENLGVAKPDVNQMKGNLLLNEFYDLCEKVLLHKGYKVERPLDLKAEPS